jgi:hypothetical protein
VWLLIATVLVGLMVVGLTRGSFGQVTRLRVVAPWLLAVGLILQAVLEYIDLPRSDIDTVGYGLLMASYALILAFCITNLRTRGFGVIAIGIALNTLVIGLNQGMPSKPIGDNAHGNRVYRPVVQTIKHRQEQKSDLLKVLDDRILFPKPFDELVSFGDLVISVGICELIYYASRRPDGAPAVTT